MCVYVCVVGGEWGLKKKEKENRVKACHYVLDKKEIQKMKGNKREDCVLWE